MRRACTPTIGRFHASAPEFHERGIERDFRRARLFQPTHAGAVCRAADRRRNAQSLRRSANFKDYEFSRATVMELWDFGYHDAQKSLADPQWREAKDLGHGVHVYDLTDAAG
ncbi:DUF3734 domain-containing protein [Paraburkholderia sediminicola]|uniref:DUF3734 domain-containing protein n=1 Tax=Paraburkholderia sediminicola TaxID=458836 RepID=UPI0038BBDAC9